MDRRIHTLAEKLWQYLKLNQQIEKSDAILVLCSHDKRVAERAAHLFLEEWAPLLIFSGGLGSITSSMWTEPEADQFAAIALGMGVPPERILIETGLPIPARTFDSPKSSWLKKESIRGSSS